MSERDWTPMSKRERIRRDAEWLYAIKSTVAPDRLRMLGADLFSLLAELEQAEKDLEGIRLALAEADVPRSDGGDEPLYSEQHRVRLLRERAEQAEKIIAHLEAWNPTGVRAARAALREAKQ